MPGSIIRGTPIAVDFWRPSKEPEARLFFLTHLHTDHTDGLSSAWRMPIYTSTITARLLKKVYKLPDSVIWELEVGESYLIPLDDDCSTITVTVLDANHVPGAVMFLFQGYFGNILYCGDMRWTPEMLENEVLRNVVQHRELDIIYLDNTYCAPYCQFPSREEVKKQIFSIIDGYPDHEIKIGINTLGREKLLEDIAQRYGEKILVSQEKFEQVQLLDCLDVFTTDPAQSRIHTFPKNKIQVAVHRKWNEEHPTITIIPTALYVGWKYGPYSCQSVMGIHLVPYSDHSSYPELMEMVSLLAPHQIYPIVKYFSKSGWWSDVSAPDQSMKADMTVFRHLLSLPPPDPIVIPESVAKLMRGDDPRLLRIQPRKRMIRKGLSPRSSKFRGVTLSSPRSHSACSFSSFSAPTPTSFTTLGSSASAYIGSINSNQLGKQIHSAKRKLVLSSNESTTSREENANVIDIETKEKETSFTKKRKLEILISERRNSLIKRIADFADCKSKKLNSQTTCSKEDFEGMLKDSKLLLKSLSCLDFLL